jgi:hypothetical protein
MFGAFRVQDELLRALVIDVFHSMTLRAAILKYSGLIGGWII